MKKKDLILAISVVIVWGINFTVIRLGLNGIPSMVLAASRYIITLIPAIFFVKKPEVSLKYLALYGLLVGFGQFSFLFYAIEIGMPAGLSSIVLQSSAFFTPLLASFFLNEKIHKNQILGLLIAAIGLIFIGRSSINSETKISMLGLLFTLIAAFFWALSNIVIKKAGESASKNGKKLNMLSMVIWSSLFPPIPLLVLAFIMYPSQEIIQSIIHINAISVFSMLYLGIASTLFGYGTWSILLSKYPATKIAPLSMLVPITGLITAQIVLNEQLTLGQWVGGAFILIGLLISNQIWKVWGLTKKL